MLLKKPIVTFLAVLLGAVLASPAVFAADGNTKDGEFIRVYMNHARVLKLDRPVSKVIVGNSQVADATVADAKTIVLTGRSFGTTNIVLLDAHDNPIVDERVLVSIDEGNTVRIFRQTQRTVFSCTPNCEQHSDLTGSGSTTSSASSSSSTAQ
jgi:Flp pilus assembly secretin CpaC